MGIQLARSEPKKSGAVLQLRSEKWSELLAHSLTVIAYRSILAEGGHILGVVIGCCVVSAASYSFPQTLLKIPFGTMAGVPIGVAVPLVVVLPLALLLNMLRAVYDERYILGPETVCGVVGLIGFKKKSTEICYRDIRVIEVSQSWYQRIFNLGDVRVGSFVADHGNIAMRGVRNPAQYKNMIERRRLDYEHFDLSGISSDAVYVTQ